MQKHKKGKTKICELCQKTFHTNYQLKRHFKTHDEKEDDRPFVCDVPECGKKFRDKYDLKRHQETLHQVLSNKKIQKQLVSLFLFSLFSLLTSSTFQEETVQQLKAENERLKQEQTNKVVPKLEVQHVDATRPDLTSHLLENRTKILIVRNPRWVLPIDSSNKKETTLCMLLGKVRFNHYFDCSKFPPQKVEEELSFKELRAKGGCIYVNDLSVNSNKMLKQHILLLLKPFLGPLLSGGEEDMLVWLDERHQIDEEGYRTDPRNYVYDNFYLYYGSLGSGTMLHFVSLLFIVLFYLFSMMALTRKKGHARHVCYQRGLEWQKEVDLHWWSRTREA